MQGRRAFWAGIAIVLGLFFLLSFVHFYARLDPGSRPPGDAPGRAAPNKP
jgi:hypothetical protein